jgi:hypothetical protein
MKILYVVSRPLEINTSASIRNRATIEGLIELGHNVDLITSEPDKNHSNYSNTIIQGLNTKYLKLGGIQSAAQIGRKYKILKPIKNLVYRYLSRVDIYDNLKSIINHLGKMHIYDNDYDLIISSSDPKSSHLFVRKMYEKKLLDKTPWVQIWGDPFLSDITRNNKRLDKKIKKEENRLLHYASKVVYVSNPTMLQQRKIYPDHADKMTHIPIPYIKEEIYPDINCSKESLTFLYCGDYSSKIRNIEPLYHAIDKTNHKLIICGNSDLKLESTDRIKIYPRVSYERTKEFEKECDVLVHLSNLKGTQIPGKIYQYSGTNKPILFILDGEKTELTDTFGTYNRYIFADNTVSELLERFDSIYSGEYNNTLFVEKSFSPLKIAQEIISLG